MLSKNLLSDGISAQKESILEIARVVEREAKRVDEVVRLQHTCMEDISKEKEYLGLVKVKLSCDENNLTVYNLGV